MNNISEHLKQLYDRDKSEINLGDLFLVCVGISDGHIYPDDVWSKYLQATGLYTNKLLFEGTVHEAIEDKFVVITNQHEDSPSRVELTTRGEQRIWNKFGPEYINLQGLIKPGIPDNIDEVYDKLAKPDIIEVNYSDYSEINISIDFHSPTEAKIFQKFLESYETFVKKNRSYGNSSLEPVGVFGNLPREAKIESRMEDKLARIRNLTDTHSLSYLDAIRDLRVYLFLYELALED